MSKTIWLLCKYASPEKYFFGTRHFFLAEEWVKNGHDVTIFTSNSSHLTNKLPKFKGSFMFEEISGVKTIWLNVIKSKKSSSAMRILSWLHFEWKLLTLSKRGYVKPDVIIASSLSIFTILSGYLLAKIYKAKFILEIRDIWPLSAIHLGGYSPSHPFMWLLSKLECFGYRKADVIVGTMPNLIEHVRNVEPRFKSCVCIPQGIKLEYLDAVEPLSSEFINSTFSSNTFKIVYAGTINPNNPIDVLLNAVEMIDEQEAVEAYILGAGSLLEKYKRKYEHCKRIKFIPQIPKHQVKAFLQKTDLCFDSIDSEIAKYGLSRNKWIDYMNAGKPIICSFDGYQSMINEADCGSFIPYNNVELLAKEIIKYKSLAQEQRIEIGIRARNFLLKNRTFSKLASDYENLFSEM